MARRTIEQVLSIVNDMEDKASLAAQARTW